MSKQPQIFVHKETRQTLLPNIYLQDRIDHGVINKDFRIY